MGAGPSSPDSRDLLLLREVGWAPLIPWHLPCAHGRVGSGQGKPQVEWQVLGAGRCERCMGKVSAKGLGMGTDSVGHFHECLFHE